MIIVFALCGLAIGWLLNLASDYFPRLAGYHIDKPAVGLSTLALPQFIRGNSKLAWVKLHAISEIGGALFLAYLWLRLGASWLILPYLAVYVFFALITIIDIKYRLVLNVLVYPAFVIVLLTQLAFVQNRILYMLVGGIFAFVIFYGTALVKPNSLGGGDIKLAALMGVLFGFPNILFALLSSAVATGIFIVFLFTTHRGGWQTRIPYAPFLCLGAMVVLIFSPMWVGSGVLF